MSQKRIELKSAQQGRDQVEALLSSKRVALANAQQALAALRIQAEKAEQAQIDEARALAKAFESGTQIKSTKSNAAGGQFEDETKRTQAAIQILVTEIGELEAELAARRAAVDQAIDDIVDERASETLAKFREFMAAAEELLPVIYAAAHARQAISGEAAAALRDFAHEPNSRTEPFRLEAALLRLWRGELESDHAAKASIDAARALLNREAAEKAERERKERDADAALRAELDAERSASYAKERAAAAPNPQSDSFRNERSEYDVSYNHRPFVATQL